MLFDELSTRHVKPETGIEVDPWALNFKSTQHHR